MNIEKVACVGAGLIGHSWATLFASKGLKVNLQDLNEGTVVRALRQIEDNLNFLEQNGLLEGIEAEKALKNVNVVGSVVDAVEGVEYVQESVFEDYDVKKKVFREMDSAASVDAILASSASGLLISEIQKETIRPARCILAHPFTPPHIMPLVEIVPGLKTSRETVESTYEFMLKVGKVPVVLKKEVTGHIVNRLQAALWREAIDLVDKGVATVEDIDKAFCAGLGIRYAIMGPHLRAHLAGGRGGIEHFLKTIGKLYSYRWEDMEAWTSIPFSAEKKIIEGTREMQIVRTKTYDEICQWRDERLLKLLKILT